MPVAARLYNSSSVPTAGGPHGTTSKSISQNDSTRPLGGAIELHSSLSDNVDKLPDDGK